MPSKLPATLVSDAFKKRVRKLIAEGERLDTLHRNLTVEMLKFGESIQSLWLEARRLDRGVGNHATHLREQLAALIGSNNRSVWSQWVKIGEQAPALLKYKGALPPQRDSLYEIAKAAADGKPIRKWVEQEKLTVESSVRDVRSLTRKKHGTRKQGSAADATARAPTQIQLHLSFSCTYERVAELLRELLRHEELSRAEMDGALKDRIQLMLGDDYAKVANKFA